MVKNIKAKLAKTKERKVTGKWTIQDPENDGPPFTNRATIIDLTRPIDLSAKTFGVVIYYSKVPKYVNLSVEVLKKSGKVAVSNNIGSNQPSGSRLIKIKSNERVDLVALDSRGVSSWTLVGRWELVKC